MRPPAVGDIAYSAVIANTREIEMSASDTSASSQSKPETLHDLLVCDTLQGNSNSKSAGESSSVLITVESCVLLHATIISTAYHDKGKEGNS